MEFNSPSTVNLVCLNIYNTVQLKIETWIYCVGGAPTRKSAAAAAARRCPKIGGGGATKKSAAEERRDRRMALCDRRPTARREYRFWATSTSWLIILQKKRSGYILAYIERLTVSFVRYRVLGEQRAGSFITTPKWVRGKRAVINVKNSDDRFFIWSILSALYPASSHSDRLSNCTNTVSTPLG